MFYISCILIILIMTSIIVYLQFIHFKEIECETHSWNYGYGKHVKKKTQELNLYPK